MKRTLQIAAILLIWIFSSCDNLDITYGGASCTGAIETTDIFTRDSSALDDAWPPEEQLGYTTYTLTEKIVSACPSKPLSLDFSCGMVWDPEHPVSIAVSVYNGLEGQIGNLDIDWNTDVVPGLLTGSGEFTAPDKSTEYEYDVNIYLMVESTGDLFQDRALVKRCFRDYTLEATYYKIPD